MYHKHISIWCHFCPHLASIGDDVWDLLLPTLETFVWASWILCKWNIVCVALQPCCAPLYLYSIRYPSAAEVGRACTQFTKSRPAAGFLHSAASDFPDIIQEWQHNCCISPVSLSFNSESYNNTASTSSCRVSGSPVVLFRWVFGEVVTDIHCVERFLVLFLQNTTILLARICFGLFFCKSDMVTF